MQGVEMMIFSYISSVGTGKFLKRTQSRTDPNPALRDPVPRENRQRRVGYVEKFMVGFLTLDNGAPQLRPKRKLCAYNRSSGATTYQIHEFTLSQK